MHLTGQCLTAIGHSKHYLTSLVSYRKPSRGPSPEPVSGRPLGGMVGGVRNRPSRQRTPGKPRLGTKDMAKTHKLQLLANLELCYYEH